MAELLGEWGFLDNLDDTSGNGRHGAANFAPVYTDGPQAGTRAIVHDDPAQHIDYGLTGLEPVDNDAGLVSMGWVKLNGSHSGYTDVICKMRGFDSTKHSIKVFDNRAWFMARWKDRIGFGAYGPDLNDGLWHHLAVVDADDRAEFYVDGVTVGSAGPASGGNTWDSFPWHSLANPDAANMATEVDMLVSGVRLFSGSMTTATVNSWMGTAIAPPGATNPTITATAPELTQIGVTWSAVANAVGYRLYVDGVEDPAGLLLDTTHTVTGLTQGVVYEFIVRAEFADTSLSDPSTPVSERASLIVSSVQCLNTADDDPNAAEILEASLAYLPKGGDLANQPYLGWRWNARGEGSTFWWWLREPAPRTPVYNYLGAWTHGMTVEKVSGDPVKIIEWNRGSDVWRETDLTVDGQTHTIDLTDLNMNAGGGPIGAEVLNCCLLEHTSTGTEGWVVRLWGHNPVPIPLDQFAVDDSVPGELTVLWDSEWNQVETRIDGGAWELSVDDVANTFTEVDPEVGHTVEGRLSTPIGPGPATTLHVDGGAAPPQPVYVGASQVTAMFLGATPVVLP